MTAKLLNLRAKAITRVTRVVSEAERKRRYLITARRKLRYQLDVSRMRLLATARPPSFSYLRHRPAEVPFLESGSRLSIVIFPLHRLATARGKKRKTPLVRSVLLAPVGYLGHFSESMDRTVEDSPWHAVKACSLNLKLPEQRREKGEGGYAHEPLSS